MRRPALASLAVLVAVLVTCPGTPSASAAPVVPTFVQGLVKARAGDLAYVPTRVPLHYRYRSLRVASEAKRVTYVFARARPAAGQPPFAVTIAPYRGRLAACGDGQQRTLQLGGNKVYWNGIAAWRCLAPPRAASVRVTVTGNADPARFASKLAYGRVAASVQRIPSLGRPG